MMGRYSIDESHDLARMSWVDGANGHSDFPIQNLPYGIFSLRGKAPRVGVAIGDQVLDLRAANLAGLLPEAEGALAQPTLNAVMSLPIRDRQALRLSLSRLLSNESHRAILQPMLHAASDCAMHMPAVIGDYTDFYTGIHHAMHVGKLFRPDNPLLPNYKYVPIGYHGRASSVRPSGDPVVRPLGQRKLSNSELPLVGPTTRLDYELEIGVWIGAGNPLGKPISISEAYSHIAGFCLLNDWSARDIQAWEYQPLGPFLAKNFHSTISPWVVTPEAMAPFRIAQPTRPEGDPVPLPYLHDEDDQQAGALAVDLEVYLRTSAMRAAGLAPHRLSRGPASNMYWTVAQLITHHTIGGCNLSPGDLLGSGTISASESEGYGSLLELSDGGINPIKLPGGETRIFLEDGDEVTMRATASASGFVSIGFGTCSAVILPSSA
jgi:fumarylacetoacetase